MWASKFASGHSAVGSTMHKWKKWDSPLCLFCRHTEEMTLHVLQCLDPAQTAVWHQSIDSFHTWLQQSDTLLAITWWLCTTLHMRGLHPAPLSQHSPLYQASLTQHSIGFFNLLLGCLTPSGKSFNNSTGSHWALLALHATGPVEFASNFFRSHIPFGPPGINNSKNSNALYSHSQFKPPFELNLS